MSSSHTAAAPESASAPSALGRYSPGLDGMRGLGIIAVLAYHGGFQNIDGSFLAISQFFTLSGFLITSILLRHRERLGTVPMMDFWSRRYRRLLPAAYACLAGVLVFGATVASREQLDELFGQVIASVAQVVNWYFIATDQSYTDLFGQPSPIQHFWSLAIEEQFYVLMPVGVFVMVRRRWSLRSIGLTLGAAAMGSVAISTFLLHRGASIDRLYYGTDTRAAELLVGCVLAVVLYALPLRGARWERILPWAGVLAFAASLYAVNQTQLTDRFWYEGGLAIWAVLSAIIITSILADRGPVATFYRVGVLALAGRLAYSIYLVHWPVFLWLTPERTGLEFWPLFGVRVGVSLVLATASYNLIEMPIRERRRLISANGMRFAVAGAVALLMLGGYLVSQRDVESELAFAAESSRPAVSRDDGIFDIIVIADEFGTPRAEALADYAESRDDVVVVLADPFMCEADADQQECTNWTSEWTELVRTADPDLVLVDVTDWTGDDLELGAGAEEAGGQAIWMEGALRSGFDVLTARGATVVWKAPVGDYEDGLRSRHQPFNIAMGAVTAENPDTRVLAVPDDRASALAELGPYQRAAGEAGVERVLVLGDSVSRSIGPSLEEWAADDGRALVWSAGTTGCGFVSDGQVWRLQNLVQEDVLCRGVSDSWRNQVEAFDPDTVLVVSPVWDAGDRQLDGWEGARSISDPELEKHILDTYGDAIEIWSSGGAKVIWANLPCVVGGTEEDQRSYDHIVRYNDVVVEGILDRVPSIELFDLAAVVCDGPDALLSSLTGDVVPRPDGIHFSREGADWLADAIGAKILGLEPQ